MVHKEFRVGRTKEVPPKGAYCVTFQNLNRAWYLDGKFHRDDGPAIEYVNGINQWYLDGYPFHEEEWETERIKWIQKEIKDEVI